MEQLWLLYAPSQSQPIPCLLKKTTVLTFYILFISRILTWIMSIVSNQCSLIFGFFLTLNLLILFDKLKLYMFITQHVLKYICIVKWLTRANLCITSHPYFFVTRTFEIYSQQFSRIKYIAITVITVLYNRAPELIPFI